MTDRAELRAALLDVMVAGRPVPTGALVAAGLDLSPDLMRRISRASREATSDAEVLLAADSISESIGGKERAAMALRRAVSGRTRPPTPQNTPTPKTVTPPSVSPVATSREDRVAARLRQMQGLPIEGFDGNLDGVPLTQFDPSNPRG